MIIAVCFLLGTISGWLLTEPKTELRLLGAAILSVTFALPFTGVFA